MHKYQITGSITGGLLAILFLCLFLSAYPAAAGEPDKNMSAEEWLMKGILFEEMGTSRLAKRAYTKAIKMNPTYAAAYYYRGISYMEMEEIRPAIRDFSRAIQLNPNEAAYRFNRGMAYGKCEEFRLAMSDFNKAIEIDEQYAPAYFWLGIVQRMFGDVQVGIDNMKVAAGLGYKDAQTYLRSRLIRWD
ncbi:MAG: tetratricopeptide repeat protein [Deltaproteobacteria bacterium]|nr:tetratricopeptide repeat protein [Deltaproteobacteria bacterium]